MINKKIKNFLRDNTYSILTPLSDISIVFEENKLTHAMLIIKESNYTQIPVLNYDKKFTGLISLHHIYKRLGEEEFMDFDKLSNYYVKDFLDTRYATINEDYDIEEVLKLLIDYNFINVISDDGKLVGMIRRSSVIKKLNHLTHNINDILFDSKEYNTNI